MTGSLTFEAIGTHWEIKTEASLSPDTEEQIHKRIEAFDQVYSRFRKDSLVTKIAMQSGIYLFPEDAKALFSVYDNLYRLTDGVVTPLVGQLLSDAGYDNTYSLKSKKLIAVPKWEDVMQYTFPNLMVKEPLLLDFGAAGKGYLVDLIGEVLQKNMITIFSINAGGDILYETTTHKKLRVGLEHPGDSTKIIGVAEIENESICGSATNRRAWGSFHHVMDPKTRKSVDDILSVWVIAKRGLIADGLATALFFVKPEVLMDDFKFEYVILTKDYSIMYSPNFPAEFY